MAITLFGFNVEWTTLGLFVFGLWIAYHFAVALYNISPFHPLNHIPGPKLAAATFLYEAYFDLVKFGRYTHEIKRLHTVYGPVIRINPEELHFNDVAFVDEIYAGAGRKRDKQAHFVGFAAGPITTSMFLTLDHDLHRLRRNAVNKFFSKAQISKLEPRIADQVRMLCEKIHRLGKDGKPFDVNVAYSCFTADVISGYCFGQSFGFVEQPEWEPNFSAPFAAFLDPIYVFRFFPILKGVTDLMPYFAKYLSENIANMLHWSNYELPARIRKAKENIDQKKFEGGTNITVFTEVLNSNLPDKEKTEFRLGGESFSLISAGTETTAWTLTVATFYLLNQPETLTKLTKELQDASAIDMTWSQLEKLPYLSAVLTESLRLSYGVSARLARVSREETLIYRGKFKGQNVELVIPKGTPMGMSNAINHHNEDIFPGSNSFIPERWLETEGTAKYQMNQAWVPFSRGSRSCLGINLAYANLYLAVASLTLRVFPQMKLYDTTVKDVAWDHDLFVPAVAKSSKGVRVAMQA